MGQLKELIQWIENQQNGLPEENMDDQQVTIFTTLELVKKQANYILKRDLENCLKNKQKPSPGHYGC